MTDPAKSFSATIWDMLSPEERVMTLLFFEAGTEGISREEVMRRFEAVWPISEDKLEAWRRTAVWGGAMRGH